MIAPALSLAGKRKTLQVDTWDNLLATHGTNFSAWNVSGGTSATASTGITLDGISGNYGRIQVPNATSGTTYWAYIRWDARSASGGNIQIMGNTGTNGSKWGDSSGTAFTISTPAVPATVPTYGERYFKVKCFGAAAGDYIVLNHTGSSSGQTIRISEFKILPPKSYHFRVLCRGDQFGSVQGTTSAGIAKRNMDAVATVGADVVIHVGDSSDTATAPSVWNQSVKDSAQWGMMCTYGNHDNSYANDAGWRSFYGIGVGQNDDNRRFPPSGNQYFHAFSIDDFSANYKFTESRGIALNNVVTASDATWKVLVSHYPTITSGANQTQDGFLRSSQGWNWYTNNVCLILDGHNHMVERNNIDSIVYQNIAKGGCDTHGWSTLETTSKNRIGGTGTSGYSGTLGVSGATTATGTGYLLLHVAPTTMIAEYWLTEGENFLDPWTGAVPSITSTDVTTHWLADRYKFEWV